METRLEHILTNSYKKELMAHMRSHPEDFNEVIKLALADRYPYSWRAAWLLWSVIEQNDPRIRDHLDDIVDALPERGDEQVRELMILLQRMDLNNKKAGKLFAICVGIWEKTGKKPSVRFNAFKLMIEVIKRHPELAKELPFLTESRYTESLSDSVKRSVSRKVSALDQ